MGGSRETGERLLSKVMCPDLCGCSGGGEQGADSGSSLKLHPIGLRVDWNV